MRHRLGRLSSLLGVIAFGAVFFGVAISNTPDSSAISAMDFKAGNIISDAVFYNKNAMTVAQIQDHLNRYMPACDMWGTGAVGGGRYINGRAVPSNTSRADYARMMRENGKTRYHEPPYVCVQHYYENPATKRNLYDSKGNIEPGMISAAQIIYDAAQEFNINPQVLLVLLKKESYVWGDNWPLRDEYNTAMGYACPDTAPCDTKYFGFYNQVHMAAWQLNYYREHIYSYGYRPYTTNSILYSPNASCGRKSVYLENIATTSLYIYTPYTPNDAALRAYPGTADCGSYGNRNFFMYFVEWFGSTQGVTANKAELPNGKYYAEGLNKDIEIVRNNDGSYRINNSANGMVFGASSNTITTSTTFAEQTDAGRSEQNWFFYALNNGEYLLSPAINASYVLTNDGKFDVYGTNNARAIRLKPVYSEKIADGDYVIKAAANKNFAIDLNMNNAVSGENIQLYSVNGADAQKYAITFDTKTGFYKIAHKASGKALDVSSASMANGANIQLWDSNDTCAQRWSIAKASDGSYEIYSSCNMNFALDVYYGTMSNGTNIQLYQGNHSAAQHWVVEKAEEPKATTPAEPKAEEPKSNQLISDGDYVIKAAANKNFAIDLNMNNAVSGENIQLYSVNGADAQKYAITFDTKTGFYKIAHKASGKVLDVSSASMANGANIQLWDSNDTCAQRWSIAKASDGSYEIYSSCNMNFALDVYYGTMSNGTNIQLYQGNHSAAQHWVVEKATSQLVPDGYYAINSIVRNNYAIDIASAGNHNGNNVWMYDRNNTNAQKFYISYDNSKKAYSIKSALDGNYFLDVNGATMANGTNIHIYSGNGTCAQLWAITKNSDDTFTIASTCDEKYVLDIYSAGTANGTNLQIYSRNNTNAQKWKLSRL